MKYVLTSLLLAAFVLSGCASVAAARPDNSGTITITLQDYDIDPDVVRVKAGQTVRMVIYNEGNHLHEMMIGRNVRIENGLTEGFEEDFFAGIEDIQVEGPGMIMGLPGMEMDMGGMDMTKQGEGGMDMTKQGEGGMDMTKEPEGGMDMTKEPEGGMDMTKEPEGGMDMTKEPEGGMDMTKEPAAGHTEGEQKTDMGGMDMAKEGAGGHTEGEAGHAQEAAGHFGAISRATMGEHHAGLMVMIDPLKIPKDQATVLTFTVPADKVGRWEFGCFQEQGQHYDDGMRAILIVDPS
jgi:plastocyanin